MGKMYVLFDMDINEVRGIYKTFEGLMKDVTNTVRELHYPCIETSYDMDIETWYFTFPHDDPKCVAHWEAYQVGVMS